MKVRKLVLIAILGAIAVAVSIAESFIPSIGIPGIKLGLANIIVLIALYELGIVEAICINLLRVFLTSLVRGSFLSMGFLMSLSGAILSLGIMIVFYLLIKKFSIVGVSVIGSIFHIFGQVIIATIYLGSGFVLYYLPVIALSAIVTGLFVGFVANAIIRTSVIRKQRDRYNF